MKLTKQAIQAINGRVKLELALALGFTEAWTTALVKKNKDNGPLTTAKALQVISEKTGLLETEILEESETAKLA